MASYCILPFFWLHYTSMWDLSSLIRDGTHASCFGGTESYPLDCQGKSPYHIYVAFWGCLFSLNLFNLTFIHVVEAMVHSFLSLTHLAFYGYIVVGYSSAEIFGLLFILAVCSLLFTSEHVSMFSCIRLCAAPWTVPAKLPSSWDCACKNTGVGCHFLLQEIFLTQGSAYGILILLPGIESMLSAMESRSLTCWTAEKSLSCFLFGRLCMTVL